MSSFFIRLALILSTIAAPKLPEPTNLWGPAPRQAGVYLFEGGDGEGSWRCTAWAVSETQLFTAAHCMPEHVPPSGVVGVIRTPRGWTAARLDAVGDDDFIHDWALVRVDKRADLDPIELREFVPGKDEELAAYGYAGLDDLTRHEGIHARGAKVQADTFIVAFDYLGRPGDSGGPILDHDGRAVALIFGGFPMLGITVGVPASTLAEILAAHPARP